MRKRTQLLCALVLFCSVTCAHAADFRIFELRNKIFSESKELKELLPSSKDQLVVLSLLDSCLILTSQIDAYFVMMSLFNNIRKEDLDKEAVGSLVNWLNQMKDSADITIRSLNNIGVPIDRSTGAHVAKLKDFSATMRGLVQSDLNTMNRLMGSVRNKRRR